MSERWDRLEPSGRDEDLEEGLQARAADPMWMLARQWQLGEFRGEDAASPIHARVFVESNPVRSFRNEAQPQARVETFKPTQPLEARVEAEAVVDGPAAVGLAAEAGTQFLRRLSLAGLGALRQSVDWRGQFGITLDGIELDALPARERLRLELLQRRGVDARKLLRARPARLRRLVGRRSWARFVRVWKAWRREHVGRFREPGASGDTWLDERLEYGFSVAAATRGGEVVLAADGYGGGHLDWSDFRVDVRPAASHGQVASKTPVRRHERLPMPVSYRGQPASRWWEFEDRTVYFGNVAAGPADLARLIVAEFAAVFSDDWYLIPLSLGTGTLNRVTQLQVLDTFGEVHDVAATAANDHAALGTKRPWAFFELEGDRSAVDGQAPWLFIPPVVVGAVNGRPVESVSFVRDEAANLGWAIEQRIELPTGASMERRQQWERPQIPRTADDDARGEPWRYRLQTPVPPWWIPLMPERVEGSSEVRLRRGRLQGWADLDPALVGAKGEIVGVRRPLRLFEEEVPRGGVIVTRHWQLARDVDGKLHLWMARRKRPGRGDRGSGLEFDVVER